VITNAVITAWDTSEFLRPDALTYALVQNDGLIKLVYSLSSLTTRCSLDVYKFPFDQQTCDINIGSWAMSDDKLDFGDNAEDPINKNFYIDNAVWSLVQTSYDFFLSQDRYSYDLVDYNIKEIKFKFILRRRPLYFMINSVFPCLVLNVLTLMSFFLPALPQFTISMFYHL
jgi:hypothetical protein